MRTVLLASTVAAAFVAAAPAAIAQPNGYGAAPAYAGQPAVTVSIAPVFAQKAQRIGIGDRDLEELQTELSRSVVRALTRAGQGAPVRADLVLVDAVPNRPTFEQYGRNVSLSQRSIGVGGASVAGQVAFADGRTLPVDFRWYESDIRFEYANATWSDAERAFDMLGRQLQRGDLKPYHRGEASASAGAFGSRFPY